MPRRKHLKLKARRAAGQPPGPSLRPEPPALTPSPMLPGREAERMEPTPEAMRRSTYAMTQLDARTKAHVNTCPTPLHVARDAGLITDRDLAAGLHLEELHNRAWGHASTRDPLDPSVRGGQAHETERVIAMRRSANLQLDRLHRLAGAHAFHVAIAAAAWREDVTRYDPRRLAALKLGLGVVAEMMGLDEPKTVGNTAHNP